MWGPKAENYFSASISLCNISRLPDRLLLALYISILMYYIARCPGGILMEYPNETGPTMIEAGKVSLNIMERSIKNIR